MPRGLVHAPHSQTWPPWPRSRDRDRRARKPGGRDAGGAPSVPSQTASIVQRTTASCPAVAATFAATNGSVARSGSSLPCVQLKISLSVIVLRSTVIQDVRRHRSRPMTRGCRGAAPATAGPPARQGRGRRRRGSRPPRSDGLGRETRPQARPATECSGVVAMNASRPRQRDRTKARAQQVDPLDQLGTEVAEEMLLDAARTVPLIKVDPIDHEPSIGNRLDPVLESSKLVASPNQYPKRPDSRGPAVALPGSARDERAQANLRIRTGGEPVEVGAASRSTKEPRIGGRLVIGRLARSSTSCRSPSVPPRVAPRGLHGSQPGSWASERRRRTAPTPNWPRFLRSQRWRPARRADARCPWAGCPSARRAVSQVGPIRRGPPSRAQRRPLRAPRSRSTPSLPYAFERCRSTVRTLSPSVAAMSALARPSAAMRKTSSSRADSDPIGRWPRLDADIALRSGSRKARTSSMNWAHAGSPARRMWSPGCRAGQSCVRGRRRRPSWRLEGDQPGRRQRA